MLIVSDEIVSASAGHARVSAGGDEHFSAGDEHVENARSNFSPTQTQPAASDFQTELISSSPPKACAFTLERSESYVDTQRRLSRPNL